MELQSVHLIGFPAVDNKIPIKFVIYFVSSLFRFWSFSLKNLSLFCAVTKEKNFTTLSVFIKENALCEKSLWTVLAFYSTM